jgi:environmental stress-induced protein Ves
MPCNSLSRCPITFWKNGKGTTQELLKTGGDPFDLRISVASITSDGPFSLYPEHNRALVLLEGSLQLFSARTNFILNNLDPYFFSGEEDIFSKLLGAEVKDFNVFYKKDRNIEIKVLKMDSTQIVLNKNIFIFVKEGQVEYEGDKYSQTLFYLSGKIHITTPVELIVIKTL